MDGEVGHLSSKMRSRLMPVSSYRDMIDSRVMCSLRNKIADSSI